MRGSQIDWGCFPLSLGNIRGLEELPQAGLPALTRKSEQERSVVLNWTLETAVEVADSRGAPYLPFSDRCRWPVPESPQEGLEKGKKRKHIHGKNEQGFLSFLLCRQLISCSDLLLISKGVSQPGVKDSLKKGNKMNIKSI